MDLLYYYQMFADVFVILIGPLGAEITKENNFMVISLYHYQSVPARQSVPYASHVVDIIRHHEHVRLTRLSRRN